MKIDVTQTIKSLDGKAIQTQDGENKKDLDLRSVVCSALLQVLPNEKPTGEEKARLYDIALRVYKSIKEIDLTTDEISLIKMRIGQQYGPIIVGQAWDLLENGSVQA